MTTGEIMNAVTSDKKSGSGSQNAIMMKCKSMIMKVINGGGFQIGRILIMMATDEIRKVKK